MGEDHKFQHHVPKFYLRNFEDNTKTIYCLYLENNRKFPTNTGPDSDIGITASDYFYDETDEKFFEKGLANFEGEWSTAVDELIDVQSIEDIDDETKANLLMFLTMQFIRTRAPREELIESIKEHDSGEDNSLISSIREDIEQDDGRSAHLILMKEGVKHIYDYLCNNGKFKLYVNNTGVPYITSDNPVVLFHNDESDKYDYRDTIGVAGDDWQLFLPICPGICLSVVYSDTPIQFGSSTEEPDDEFVELQNTLQLVQAVDIAVCGNEDYSGIDEIW